MRKIVILLIMLYLSSGKLFSQQALRIQDLGPQAKKEWQTHFDLQPTLSGEYEYALLKNGIVTYSEKTQTLTCVDFDGRIIWEKTGIPSPTSPIASPDGEYLYIYRLTVPEGQKGIGSIWTKDGEVLWEQKGRFYKISPSGKFLVSYFDALNPYLPLKVLDIKTGRILWELEKTSYWQAAASENDRLVYYSHRNIKLFELGTGKLIWEKTIESDIQKNLDASKIHISKNGKTVALQAMFTLDDHIETYVLDGQGQLLWKMSKKLIPGETNGGIIQAISDDGKFIAMSDLQRFLLFNSDNSEPVWVLNERMRPQYVQAFVNGVLAFRPHSNRTRVLVLNPNGTIKQDYLFPQRIEFKTPWPGKALVVEPNRDRLGLSLFDLTLDTSN